jgi:hypothetical protein
MRHPVLCSATLLLGACAAPSLDLQPRYGKLDIAGSAGFTSGGLGGTADLAQAGLEEDELVSGRADLEFGSPHLIALAQSPEFSGSGTLDVTVSDGTNTIIGGAAVDSEIGLDQYTLALVFDLVPGDTFELALGLGATYLDASFLFAEQGTGTTVASDEQVPVPMLVVAASAWLGPVELAAMVGGADYEYDDDSVYYVDADLYARWKIFGGDERLRTSLVLGYRRTELELDYDDASTAVDADLTIDGFYAGLEVSL